MKYILIVGDGLADYPLPELNNKTPVEYAYTPGIDWISRHGVSGLAKTIPPNMPADSAVAILSVLGYNPETAFPGRGVLEALSRNIPLDKNDIVFRANLIYIKDKIITDYSADHISTEESDTLINSLNNLLRGKYPGIRLYTGLSYRHILILRGNSYTHKVGCFPPHDHQGEHIENLFPFGDITDKQSMHTAQLLQNVIEESIDILEKEEINQKRIGYNKKPANCLWPWSAGKLPQIEPFQEKAGLSGGIVAAVDVIKGIGKLIGFEAPDIPGATGYYDTDYNAKRNTAFQLLEKYDLVFIHIEAPDEAGHEKKPFIKKKVIEDIDKYIVTPIVKKLRDSAAIVFMCDHYTPVSTGKHVAKPVPVSIYYPGITPDDVPYYSEKNARNGLLGIFDAKSLIKRLVEIKK